jgi:hexosaminidase
MTACGTENPSSETTATDEFSAGSSTAQRELDALGAALKLRFHVIENIPAECPPNAPWGLCLDAKIVLKNTGGATRNKRWAIYYSGIRKVLSVNSDQFTITHINGDLHKIEPTAAFTGFGNGETKEIAFKAEYWMMSESDVMPRFYLAADGLKPVTIANTNTEDFTSFVDELTDPKQTRRHPADQSVIATAATRFAENAATLDLGDAGVTAQILPSPMNVTAGTGTVVVAGGVSLVASGIDDASLEVVRSRIRKLGVPLKTSGGVVIKASVNAADAAFAGKSSKEAYRLSITATGVEVVGADAAGAFYGLQSMLAALNTDCAGGAALPVLEVSYDAPRYSYRGVQLDLARNYHGPASVLKVLDQMAAYKLNTLHLHLADDEGFRLEIPGLPELTSVGAKRCHDLTDSKCLLPQLGSGPTTQTAGSGFLSRSEFVSILRAARARNIEVIPEFDMPGHARAAIKAMEARARSGDTTYLLSDPDDNSQYLSIQNYTDNAINACMDSSYAFLGKLMDEVGTMYRDAGAKLSTWHLGGDEVGAGAWTASPACEALYAQSSEVKDADDVHGYFVKRANQMAMERGFGIRGWSDGLRKTVTDSSGNAVKVFLDPATDLAGNAVSTNWWGTLFWWDNSAYTMANAGYKVVLTSPDFLYFDHPYEADPKERGYYWATRFTSVRKLFGYMPANLPANSQLTKDRMGGDYTGAFAGIATLEKPENVLGMEGALWGETVRTAEQLEYMVFPRLLALAERAWHRGNWEPADGNDYAAPIDMNNLAADWQRFANVLGHKELKKVERSGVQFRVEVPGAIIDNGVLKANVAMPGLGIQYRTPGSRWLSYNAQNPPRVSSAEVRAVSYVGRAGRSVSVQ